MARQTYHRSSILAINMFARAGFRTLVSLTLERSRSWLTGTLPLQSALPSRQFQSTTRVLAQARYLSDASRKKIDDVRTSSLFTSRTMSQLTPAPSSRPSSKTPLSSS